MFCCIDFSHLGSKIISYQGHPMHIGVSMKLVKRLLSEKINQNFLCLAI